MLLVLLYMSWLGLQLFWAPRINGDEPLLLGLALSAEALLDKARVRGFEPGGRQRCTRRTGLETLKP